MTAPTSRPRQAADACPGVGRPFVAADGSIVRLRPAGRPVPVEALARLLDLVESQPDPAIQLTSRAALQLRGLPDPLSCSVRESIESTGLVPSLSHELVRNVVASPLSGLDDAGHCDVRHVTRALDAALCADPDLARLGGRFLFALDDGRGDVIRETFDLGVLATGRGRCVVLAGGTHRGWDVPLEAAVPTLLALAREFVERTRGGETAWHVHELDAPLGPAPTTGVDLPARPARPLGAVGDHAVVAVPLGLLRREHVGALGRVTDEVRVTPWRSLVVEHGAAALADLEEAGLATHPESAWHRLHACTGLPGCARSALDTRALARRLAPVLPAGRLPVHVSGCERRCGTPSTAYVDILAPVSPGSALRQVRDEDAPSRRDAAEACESDHSRIDAEPRRRVVDSVRNESDQSTGDEEETS
ncbi:precorrin-3B synthase [Terrabacter sp. MAHUQ-38]|uniref:precorrin-3B synthase n=1 Tax=unclassified Terrabacter TaxID=2630222 RepID=UPI00165D9484|nr:precorrin-3B synthase [Terrabacter sp. MAHUQ-38]MBC9819987.1 precorrin-3B synthase [Terrabacter sp. MAHUQ-38]